MQRCAGAASRCGACHRCPPPGKWRQPAHLLVTTEPVKTPLAAFMTCTAGGWSDVRQNTPPILGQSSEASWERSQLHHHCALHAQAFAGRLSQTRLGGDIAVGCSQKLDLAIGHCLQAWGSVEGRNTMVPAAPQALSLEKRKAGTLSSVQLLQSEDREYICFAP